MESQDGGEEGRVREERWTVNAKDARQDELRKRCHKTMERGTKRRKVGACVGKIIKMSWKM